MWRWNRTRQVVKQLWKAAEDAGSLQSACAVWYRQGSMHCYAATTLLGALSAQTVTVNRQWLDSPQSRTSRIAFPTH